MVNRKPRKLSSSSLKLPIKIKLRLRDSRGLPPLDLPPQYLLLDVPTRKKRSRGMGSRESSRLRPALAKRTSEEIPALRTSRGPRAS